MSAGETDEVSLLFVTNLKPNEVAVRKYNPNTQSYATITDANISQSSYEGSPALLVTYNIADNGPLDTDPDEGEVADPVGLAVLGVNAPNTGLKTADQSANAPLATILASAAVVSGLFISPIRQKITSRIASEK